MIEDKYLKEIYRNKMLKTWHKVLPFIIFGTLFIISYKLNFKYSENTNLFNDKLIDVSSIFFGIFIGCLYLFEKFKSKETYKDFLYFCKILLYQDIIIIAFSFIIILINDNLQENLNLYKEIIIRPKSLIFSIYVAFFGVTLYNIFKFIKIVLKILKLER